MTDDIGFSIKGAGKIILFFFCSFILADFLGALSWAMVLLIPEIAVPIAPFSFPWIFHIISIFVAYLISGSILRLYTKNWNMFLYFLIAVICGFFVYLIDFVIVPLEFGLDVYSGLVFSVHASVNSDLAFDEIHTFFIQLTRYSAPVLGVFLGAVVIGNLLVAKTDLAKMKILPNIIKGSAFIFFVLICVAYSLSEKEEGLNYGLYIADNNLFSRVVEHMEDQDMAFKMRTQENGIEYIYFNRFYLFEVRRIVPMFKGTEGGFERGALCKPDINDRNAILVDFVENNIDHIIYSSDSGHCFYWSSEDASKVSSILRHTIESSILRHMKRRTKTRLYIDPPYKNLFSRIVKNMEDQGVEFEVRTDENGIEYIYREVEKLTQTLQEEDDKYTRGLCQPDINDRNAILKDFVDHNIDHKIESSTFEGHCIYWHPKDTDKVSEHVEVYKEIGNSNPAFFDLDKVE